MTKTDRPQRLGKYLSTCGVASRRRSEVLIREGRVCVKGRKISDPAFAVFPGDEVTFDGETVTLPSPDEMLYIMLHKPVGVVSTMSASREKGRILTDLLNLNQRVFPVGRLDRESSGLILMTNDGELTHKLTHPSHQMEKQYIVKLQQYLNPREIGRFRRGIVVDDRRVAIDQFEQLSRFRFAITIHEGRNRIIRRMMDELRKNVIELKRVRIGSLTLGSLGIGKWRKLTATEVKALWRN